MVNLLIKYDFKYCGDQTLWATINDVMLTHWGWNMIARIFKHFQMHFLEKKPFVFFIEITEVCSYGPLTMIHYVFR